MRSATYCDPVARPDRSIGDWEAFVCLWERLDMVREELAALIVDGREREGRYSSLDDFLARVPAGIDEVDSLVAAGALDDVDEGLVRSQLRVVHRRLRWAGGKPVSTALGRRVTLVGGRRSAAWRGRESRAADRHAQQRQARR